MATEENLLNGSDALIQSLTDLAMDLHWTWNHATDKIWRQLDPVLWDLTHNPLVVIQTVSHDRLKRVVDDPLVRATVDELMAAKRQTARAPAWFQNNYPASPLSGVAFFSMEFMLCEALPIYSGGLGNVAGDFLKTASDLGVPVTGIGLLYQQGYPRQVIYENGDQQYVCPFNDPGILPLIPLRNEKGEWLRIQISLPGFSLWLRTWKVEVGRVNLFLLDSNDAANFPVHRGITNELYGGGSQTRLMQELILGMGGLRLLQQLGIQPEICHLNEGHTAFAVVERAAIFMEENNVSFEEALTITRAGNIFTTHTAVGAGFDLFEPRMVEQFLGRYIHDRIKISLHDFLALGREDPADNSEPFNTAYLAIRGSGKVNGVSRLHGAVSRQLFARLFPRWPLPEVPVSHVTNGVHMPTWDSAEADSVWTEACGKDRWLGTQDGMDNYIRSVSNERLWALRTATEEEFILYIRNRYSRQLAMIGMPVEEIEAAKEVFDPEILTIGFARRFAEYKRTNLLLNDRGRLKRILTNRERPVQLIIGGKAHAGDKNGQARIKEWVDFIHSEGLKQRIIFLSDYDMLLSEHLVQGVDLWINTPRRPWEACGTSGMKVLVNGGLNLSELDGWWDEAYSPELGWALGDRLEHGIQSDWDDKEADHLYTLLEEEIIPAFYNRDADGIPKGWVNRMRESMARLTPAFSANRSLREYTENYYLPAAANFLQRASNNGEKGKEIYHRNKSYGEKWRRVFFGTLNVQSKESTHEWKVLVHLYELLPQDVKVEMYAEGTMGAPPEKYEMKFEKIENDATRECLYTVRISSSRPSSDFTPRILPNLPGISIPLENNLILWEH